jgi:hypothetical protein
MNFLNQSNNALADFATVIPWNHVFMAFLICSFLAIGIIAAIPVVNRLLYVTIFSHSFTHVLGISAAILVLILGISILFFYRLNFLMVFGT